MIELLGGDLYQWDTGRKLKITPENGENIHEVHITSKGMSIAYVINTQPEDDYLFVPIPNKILQQFRSLQCYEVIENGNGEQTVSETVFPIYKRNKPDDYVYTETEIYNYKKLAELSEQTTKETKEQTIECLSKVNSALLDILDDVSTIEHYSKEQLPISVYDYSVWVDKILKGIPFKECSCVNNLTIEQITPFYKEGLIHGEVVFVIVDYFDQNSYRNRINVEIPINMYLTSIDYDAYTSTKFYTGSADVPMYDPDGVIDIVRLLFIAYVDNLKKFHVGVGYYDGVKDKVDYIMSGDNQNCSFKFNKIINYVAKDVEEAIDIINGEVV